MTGLPNVKFPYGFTVEGSPLWTREDLKHYTVELGKDLPGRERAALMAKWALSTLLRRRLVALSNTACPRCWLLGMHCCCRSLPPPIMPPFADAATGSCTLLRNNMKVTLVMNSREVCVCFEKPMTL